MNLLSFLASASLVALSSGPGILHVAARTLAGGRHEGLASSLGTAIGGVVHVDIAVVLLASRARHLALGRPTLLARFRTGAGLLIAGLGVDLLLSRRPA